MRRQEPHLKGCQKRQARTSWAISSRTSFISDLWRILPAMPCVMKAPTSMQQPDSPACTILHPVYARLALPAVCYRSRWGSTPAHHCSPLPQPMTQQPAFQRGKRAHSEVRSCMDSAAASSATPSTDQRPPMPTIATGDIVSGSCTAQTVSGAQPAVAQTEAHSSPWCAATQPRLGAACRPS